MIINGKLYLEYEYVNTWEEMHKITKECEGKHTQQVVVSTFHDGLTQIDWTDKVIRSTIKR
jgi:hypothetical protein